MVACLFDAYSFIIKVIMCMYVYGPQGTMGIMLRYHSKCTNGGAPIIWSNLTHFWQGISHSSPPTSVMKHVGEGKEVNLPQTCHFTVFSNFLDVRKQCRKAALTGAHIMADLNNGGFPGKIQLSVT